MVTHIEHVDEILRELNGNPNVLASLMILKSGMLVAGQLPEEAHLETFVVMASLMISAAESATSDLKGEFENVYVELDRARIIIESAGKKGVLVVITDTKDNNGHLNAQIKKTALNLGAAV